MLKVEARPLGELLLWRTISLLGFLNVGTVYGATDRCGFFQHCGVPHSQHTQWLVVGFFSLLSVYAGCAYWTKGAVYEAEKRAAMVRRRRVEDLAGVAFFTIASVFFWGYVFWAGIAGYCLYAFTRRADRNRIYSLAELLRRQRRVELGIVVVSMLAAGVFFASAWERSRPPRGTAAGFAELPEAIAGKAAMAAFPHQGPIHWQVVDWLKRDYIVFGEMDLEDALPWLTHYKPDNAQQLREKIQAHGRGNAGKDFAVEGLSNEKTLYALDVSPANEALVRFNIGERHFWIYSRPNR